MSRDTTRNGGRTLVLGLGNPILTDDGVGVLVARAVADALPPGAGIEVSEVSIGGLRLMERMIGYERVILVDALVTGACAPGTVRRMDLDELRAVSVTQHSASAHDATLVTALDTGRRLGLSLPSDLVIFGIEVQNTIDFSERPTGPVAAAVPRATAAVLVELGYRSDPEGVPASGRGNGSDSEMPWRAREPRRDEG